MNDFFRKIKSRSVEIFSLIGFVCLWEFLAVFVVRDSLYLPGFHDVALAFVDLLGDAGLYADMGVSLRHFLSGAVAAIVVGIPVGILMGWFPQLSRCFNPIVEILRPIPPLAWIPFAIIWFKLTHEAAAMIIFIGMVFPIIVNTYTGFRNVPKIYVEAAKVLGCLKNVNLIRYVAIPAASPMILSGIRISMGIGWMCLASAEMFGVSSAGIGYKIWFWYGLHRMELVVVYMLILGLLGLFIDLLFRNVVEKRMLKWQAGTVI